MSHNKECFDSKGIAQILIAGVVIAGFFTLIVMLFWPNNLADKALDSARLMMLGALIAGFSSVLGYYFGSTSGAAQKNALLANSTQMPSDPVQVTTTSQQGLVRTTLLESNQQEIIDLQVRLDVLQSIEPRSRTEADLAELARITRRLDELRNTNLN